MRADDVTLGLICSTERWHFISFPFDVKVSDIQVEDIQGTEDTRWVIRKYSGEARAKQEFDKTWQNMTADSILHAGEGYIFQCSNGSDAAGVLVPAINNADKNLIFANDSRSIPLKEYVSEFGHNRSWNLIGNPFPCYYDTREMEYTAPITVWNNNGYTAYSPVDDEYILCPSEAFFVQRPVDKETIGFPVSGRQANRVVMDKPFKVSPRNTDIPRYLFNLTLKNEEYADRTRFVINEAASVNYEMERDASKFMSMDTRMPQLFTLEGDIRFAINERPYGNGVITLGTYFGNEGTYTLALNGTAEAEVTLVDKMEGKEVSLNEENYTFNASAGTVTNRFFIKLGKEVTSVETVMQTAARIYTAEGKIWVKTPETTDMTVYTAEGKQVATARAASASFEVENGFYIVRVQGVSYKVAVTR